MRVSCPTCNRPVVWSQDNPSRPFCSERCRLIDLGQWLAPDEPEDDNGTRIPNADAANDH